MFGWFKTKDAPGPADRFPPVPRWRPAIHQPIDQIIERVACYTDRKQDFVVYTHGTCVLLPKGLAKAEAIATAGEILSRICNDHPDMTPTPMDDGNLVVRYRHPALNVVLSVLAERHRAEIDRNHLDALVAGEVLITPLGPNRFDDFGKKALLGRCFMFMDAGAPEVIRVVRTTA